jgi:hypothetical protein
MLRISPAQAPRLLEIEHNTRERLGEARQMQWLGEVAALEESLRHITKKVQIDQRTGQALAGEASIEALSCFIPGDTALPEI